MSLGSKNRRKETRFRSMAGSRMAWHSEEGRRARRKGWTLDQSASGFGFLVEKPRIPHAGEMIRVHDHNQPDAQLYEVVRIAELPGKLAVVGCEKVFGTSATIKMPPPAWAKPAACKTPAA